MVTNSQESHSPRLRFRRILRFEVFFQLLIDKVFLLCTVSAACLAGGDRTGNTERSSLLTNLDNRHPARVLIAACRSLLKYLVEPSA